MLFMQRPGSFEVPNLSGPRRFVSILKSWCFPNQTGEVLSRAKDSLRYTGMTFPPLGVMHGVGLQGSDHQSNPLLDLGV